jgi:hypothetical protein
MNFPVENLLDALKQAYPGSHVRLLPEPAMFLRSNLGRSYTAEGMHIVSLQGALDYAQAYMSGLTERTRGTEGFELNPDHPWIIGVFPGNEAASALIFIFGNIIRNGKESWVEVGYPTYQNLEF